MSELGDLVDVWLVDYKYASAELGRKLSHVPDYPVVASRALARMCAEVARRGGELVDGDGLMRRGVIVRHLVLPGHADDSRDVLDCIWRVAGDVPISVMNQYTPNARMRAVGGELARPVTDEETSSCSTTPTTWGSPRCSGRRAVRRTDFHPGLRYGTGVLRSASAG